MKLKCRYKGDINAFVFAVLSGRVVTVLCQGIEINLGPRLSQKASDTNIVLSRSITYPEHSLMAPVVVLNFGSEAVMSFSYDTGLDTAENQQFRGCRGHNGDEIEIIVD